VALRRRADIEASEGRDILRLAKRGGSSLLYTGMVCGAILVCLFVSLRLNQQFDVSRQGTNKLSEQTLRVLAGLEQDVKFYALYRKEPADRRESHWNVLRRYRDASPRITGEFYDPVRRPGIVRGLGLNPDEQGQNIDGMIVAVLGEHRLPLDPSTRKLTFRITSPLESEEVVTNAILELTRERERRVVGMLRGYAEHDSASEEAGGFSRAVQALEQEYYDVRDVYLADGIPDDVSVLVAAGPRLPIAPADLERLAAWLTSGGRLLVMLDPGEATGLETVLDEYGLSVQGGRIEDPQQNMGDFTYLRVTRYSDTHEAVRGFGKSLMTGFPETVPVVHEEAQGSQFHAGLASTSAFAYFWNDDGTRTAGPFDVAAASWFNEDVSSARVVLVGDSDFASNAYLAVGYNRNFFLNSVAWLARRQELMTIRRPLLAGQVIKIGEEEGSLLVGIVLAAPLLMLVAGTVMYFRRRSL